MEGAAEFGGKLAHVVGHGVTGGAANAAMGGKFQDGFLSAAAGATAVHTGLYGAFKGPGPINVAGRTAIAGMIGGTASALGGGKFANGAYTAAFQHLLNNESGQPRGAWTKEQGIAELAKDGIELNWFERLMFKHEAIGNGMERTANALGGLGDGVSMGGAEWISKQVYGDEAVWADKSSAMYTTGYVGGVAITMVGTGGSVASTRAIASGATSIRATSYAAGVTANINSGKWAVTGGRNIYSYFKTGLWGGRVDNGVFSWIRMKNYSSATASVRLRMPSSSFFGRDGNWKAYIFGQFRVR
jgi:hypothetical protein